MSRLKKVIISARIPSFLDFGIEQCVKNTGLLKTEILEHAICEYLSSFDGSLKKNGVDYKEIAETRRREIIRNHKQYLIRQKMSEDFLVPRMLKLIYTYCKNARTEQQIEVIFSMMEDLKTTYPNNILLNREIKKVKRQLKSKISDAISLSRM